MYPYDGNWGDIPVKVAVEFGLLFTGDHGTVADREKTRLLRRWVAQLEIPDELRADLNQRIDNKELAWPHLSPGEAAAGAV
jgi:hypothetical protein